MIMEPTYEEEYGNVTTPDYTSQYEEAHLTFFPEDINEKPSVEDYKQIMLKYDKDAFYGQGSAFQSMLQTYGGESVRDIFIIQPNDRNPRWTYEDEEGGYGKLFADLGMKCNPRGSGHYHHWKVPKNASTYLLQLRQALWEAYSIDWPFKAKESSPKKNGGVRKRSGSVTKRANSYVSSASQAHISGNNIISSKRKTRPYSNFSDDEIDERVPKQRKMWVEDSSFSEDEFSLTPAISAPCDLCKQNGDDNEYEVEGLLGLRINNSSQYEYLVKWKGCSVLESTWEPIASLYNCTTLVNDFNVNTAPQNVNSFQDPINKIVLSDETAVSLPDFAENFIRGLG